MHHFLEYLFTDIDSLTKFAGIHETADGFQRLLSKRFPFAIYCTVVGEQVRVSAVPVVSVQQGDALAEQAGPAIQVAWAQAGPRSIGLADGLSIAGVADPATVSDDTVPGTSLIVADRDLAELADILGQGSRVLVRH